MSGDPWRRALARMALACVPLGMVAAVLMSAEGTLAAPFTAKTNNAGSSFGLGSIVLNNDLGGTAVFTTSDARLTPGSTLNKCIQVQYTGTLALAGVKLYATASDDPDSLGAQLTLTVHEGTGTAGATCAGFTAGPQIYTGTLSNFVSTQNSYANGVGSWAPSSAANRMYRLSLTLSAGAPPTMQGAESSTTFRWEGQ